MKQIKNKKVLSIVAIIVVITLGYLFANRASSPTIEEKPTNTAQQGKLNINAICDGALMYMTFDSGASAEKFVAECKEGKHPEVIERYKVDMNLGDGAQI